ncbi:MAG: hypothetical protein ACRC77_13175 [Bacteroidales bacterium]
MIKNKITWNDLYNHIATMSEEERAQPVLVWGDEEPISNEVALCIDDEDMVFDPEGIDSCAMLRSDFDEDYEPELALKAGTTYLYR